MDQFRITKAFSLISIKALLRLTRQTFAPFAKSPPGLGNAALHEIDGRHEDIDDTGIMPLLRDLTKFAVKLEGILLDQLLGTLDPNQAQISGAGLADVRQIFQPLQFFSIR